MPTKKDDGTLDHSEPQYDVGVDGIIDELTALKEAGQTPRSLIAIWLQEDQQVFAISIDDTPEAEVAGTTDFQMAAINGILQEIFGPQSTAAQRPNNPRWKG